MKTYVLAAMLLAAVGTLGYMMGEHSAAENYRLIVEEATKQREAERDSLLKENQDAWAKEAEYRKALDTANANVRSLTERLRNATRPNRLPETTSAALAHLEAENARLRGLLERCTEFLGRSTQEYGDCASSHDTAVNLYQAARK